MTSPRRIAAADLNNLGVPVTTIEVTTGAAPVDVDIPSGCGRLIVNVTSGGTAGDEVLNLPELAGLINAGLLVMVSLAAQTDPADVVNVTVAGQSMIPFTDSLDGEGADPLILDYEEASAGFIWCGDAWFCNPQLTDYNFNYTVSSPDLSLQAPGSGGSFEVSGRSGAVNGGDMKLGTGAAGSGRQGTVVITGSGLIEGDTDCPVGGLYYDSVTKVVFFKNA